MQNRTLASIDIGTNTFRLLISGIHYNSETNNYSLEEIYSERIITRLGEGMHEKRILNEIAVQRSITALKKFSSIISRNNVFKTSAIATSALREAVNSESFLDRAKNEAGIEIHTITGEEEAKITASGMLIDIPVPKTALMADIGGGSTELIFTQKGMPSLVYSINLGVVYLAGKYMVNDPIPQNDLDMMNNEIRESISGINHSFSELLKGNTIFIGTAGTVTTLAAVAQNLATFHHDKIHNYKLSIDKVRDIYFSISKLRTSERAKYIPFEPDRLDIIVPGTLILFQLMENFNFQEITVSNYGLREGILIDLYNQI